jgi:hypothetical protein
MTIPRQCRHAKQQALADDLLLTAVSRGTLPTNTIDQIPPWRARMIVQVCLAAGATLEHGDPEQFDQAARAAGRQDAGQTGWWRVALGMAPREELPPAPAAGAYVPPAGWKVVSGDGGI